MSDLLFCISSANGTVVMMMQLVAMLLVMSIHQLFGIFGLGFRLTNQDEAFFLKSFDLFFAETSCFWFRIGTAAFSFLFLLDFLLLLFVFGPIFLFPRILIVSLLFVSSLLTRSVWVVVAFLFFSLLYLLFALSDYLRYRCSLNKNWRFKEYFWLLDNHWLFNFDRNFSLNNDFRSRNRS